MKWTAPPASFALRHAATAQQNLGVVAKDLGGVAGYKAALTNPAVQKRFKPEEIPLIFLDGKLTLGSVGKAGAWLGASPDFEVASGVAWLLGGVVVIEKVFNYPGLGRLMIDSISMRDFAIISTFFPRLLTRLPKASRDMARFMRRSSARSAWPIERMQ